MRRARRLRRHATSTVPQGRCPPCSPCWPCSPSQRPPPPIRAARPGPPGIGDKLYPTLGNGGYDVLHYDVDLRYATSAPAQPVEGTVTIVARATHSLSRFDLDFAGDAVGAVTVDGRSAQFSRAGDELVITPRRTLDRGRLFVVGVRGFVATPTAPNPDDLLSTAFFTTPDGSATAGQPDSSHVFLPSTSGDVSDVIDINRYWGGALVLYALREEIGTAAFERLERAWVRRYRDRVASSADFIALASRIGGRDVGPFLRACLYDAHTPAMPNHPDWTVLPPAAPAARAQLQSIRLAADFRRR